MLNKISVIIVAAGKGLRMGSELPKQFLSFSSRPLLFDTIEAIHNALPDAELILVLNPVYIDYWSKECLNHEFNIAHKVVEGGDERFHSVQNGVRSVSADSKIVLIHDGVRPLVTKELIDRVVCELRESVAVIPVVPLVDSIREIVGADGVTCMADRKKFVAVQTPQGFHRDVIDMAYSLPFDIGFTDDASVVERCGYSITTTDGDRINIKITTEEDLLFAKSFCALK